MIRRPAGDLRINTVETKLAQFEFIDENVDRSNGIILINPFFQIFGKKRALLAIQPFNEAPHLILPQIARESYRENQIQPRVFTQPGSLADKLTRTKIHRCPLLSKSGPILQRSKMTVCARSRHSASSFDYHFSAEQFRVGADDR